MSNPGFSRQDVLKIMSTSRKSNAPPGWKSIRQLAKDWGCTADSARSMMQRALTANAVVTKRFRDTDGRPVKHYMLKKT